MINFPIMVDNLDHSQSKENSIMSLKSCPYRPTQNFF